MTFSTLLMRIVWLPELAVRVAVKTFWGIVYLMSGMSLS